MDEPKKTDRSGRFVRFDFPLGAGAGAIEAARKKIVAEYAERQRKKNDGQAPPKT